MKPDAPCPFCSPDPEDIIAENTLCYARWDRYPASPGHALIIPFRHAEDLFSLTAEERCALLALADDVRAVILSRYSPAGYNIGINVGSIAGQSVMHCHCHVIPRYPGDADSPRGGIRGVIRKSRNPVGGDRGPGHGTP